MEKEKSTLLQIVDEPISILAAKTNKTPFEAEVYKALLLLREGIEQADSEEALNLWLDFMWRVLSKLGMSKE